MTDLQKKWKKEKRCLNCGAPHNPSGECWECKKSQHGRGYGLPRWSADFTGTGIKAK